MENIPKVYIRPLDLDMASVISQNSRENLYAFLKRMDLEVESYWEKEVLSLLLKDTIMENPEYILHIFGKEVLQFLIYLWEYEKNEIIIEQKEWAMMGQLKFLGFVDFTFVEQDLDRFHIIYIIQEARDAFYFYLKSKTAKMMMDRFYTWEQLIRGMMAHYGIISFGRLYYQFCRLIKSPIDDSELHRFLSSRFDLHHFGCFAVEKPSNIEYYQSYEISNPEQVVDKRQEMKEVDFFCPAYDDAIYIAQNNGIGDWDGISTIAEIFLQLLDIEYYKTVIAIKTCILMVQNDEKVDAIEAYLLGSYPECRPYKDKIHDAVYFLYNSVPVYSLKGYSRKKLKKTNPVTPLFTMIRGGKTGSRKKGGNRNECQHPDC